MVPPEYYWKIIAHLDEHNYPASISFTTNLWDFKLRPERWVDLFKHERVGVCTSFQYGGARRITKGQEFTEEHFREVMHLFNEEVGYYPTFIAVIDELNEDTVLKTVELAKRFGVVCKCNYANASGRQGAPYPLSKMYKHYMDIIDADLYHWEYNTLQVISAKGENTCPLSRDCDSGIRALNPDGSYYSCGSFADDRIYAIDFTKELASKDGARPLSFSPFLYSLKEECLSCPMFELCNGCRKHVFDIKTADIVEEHCVLMKKIEPRITANRRKYGALGKESSLNRDDSTTTPAST